VKTICHRFQWVEEKKNSMEVSRNGRVQGPEFLGYGSFFSSFSSKLLPWRIGINRGKENTVSSFFVVKTEILRR
jgi:hypothetical protein